MRSTGISHYFTALPAAPCADALHLPGRNVQELEKFLVLVRGGFLAFLVPVAYLCFGECCIAHDFCPFRLGDHFHSPELLCACERACDFTQAGAELFDFGAELEEAALGGGGGVGRCAVGHGANVS